MSAFKKVYDSGFCRRVKVAVRKGKFHSNVELEQSKDV
jgi:hypothetical protein